MRVVLAQYGTFSLILVTMLAPCWAWANQRARVAPAARDIRGFVLTQEHLRKFAAVTALMDRLPFRGPEAPRADVAVFTVLSMSLSFNEPFTERTVPDTVRTIQAGHPELADAVREAGLPLDEYVLTHITLLLAYPVIAAERLGRPPAPSDDVSAANLAFVRTNWNATETAFRGLREAVARYAR